MKTTIQFFSIKQISVALLLFSVSNNSSAMLGRLIGRPLVRRPMLGIRACQAPAGNEKSKDEQIQALEDECRKERAENKVMRRYTIPLLINKAKELLGEVEKDNLILSGTNTVLKEKLAKLEQQMAGSESPAFVFFKVHVQNMIDQLQHENNDLRAANAALQKENAGLRKLSQQCNENEILK